MITACYGVSKNESKKRHLRIYLAKKTGVNSNSVKKNYYYFYHKFQNDLFHTPKVFLHPVIDEIDGDSIQCLF